ncbi:MAG: 23S rRNA (uracil(1939)-C(5))-methyltransferase RlmD, partial [Clostridia bacterium]|nr:23S rRNA (uracil(1939)-C(5))-methyltransferase RlmD [Clostridia bacterium]
DKRYAFGRMTALHTPSKDRVNTDERACDVYEKCGGCVWRHVTYAAETQYKWQKVADALAHIGGLDIIPQPIVAAENADRYRNKAQYPLAVQDGKPIAGFYAPRSHRVIPCADCALQPAFFADILRAVLCWAEQNGVAVYDETRHTGLLRHVYIRHGEKTGEVMVCLVATSGKLPALPMLVEALKKATPLLRSVVVNINRKDTNVILGDEEFTVFGDGYITDTLCDLRFKLSPRSFFQVNPVQTEKLYTLAKEALALTGEETLLDLYCGTGTIGLSMAKNVKSLIGVEIVAPAIEDAKQNAKANGITNARFICADAAAAAKQLEKEGIRPDAVVIDPPRKGCDEALIDTIATMAPSKVVYVSCDPATLARDLARFAARGYETQWVTPVDLFPGTQHCEAVARLRRKNTVHAMKLFSAPYEMIKSGEKTIELRLYDEKRQQIKVGDAITFTNTANGEKLTATVKNLHRFNSFEELYKSLPLLQCGYTVENIDAASPRDMEQYYS